MMARTQLRRTSFQFVSVLAVTICGGCSAEAVVDGPAAAVPSAVLSLEMTPASVTFRATGDTLRLHVIGRDLRGQVVADLQLAWASSDSRVVAVDSDGLLSAVGAGTAVVDVSMGTLRDSSRVTVTMDTPIDTTAGSSLTPEALRAVLGPIVGRSSSPSVASLQTYDQRYTSTEYARYQDFLAVENDPSGSYLSAQHYGGLRGRLMWAIRNGQPYGAGVTDETKYAYARGRRIVKRYLQYSKANNFATQAHNNTGLADIEALYVLEGDQDALTHIHVSAMLATTDNWGYLKMQNSNSDARQIAVALQALMAAHRLGIPYVRNPANGSVGFDASLGSWKAAAQRQIDWLTQYNIVHADGSIPSPAHGGTEAYLFNAWLATQLLDWYGYVQADGNVLQMAQRIMDHLIASQRSGWATLPYLANGTTPAYDLAAFYVWPSLVLWQETGDAKYKNFALQNLAASNQAFISAMKQWNQTYSTLGEGTAALLNGVSWR